MVKEGKGERRRQTVSFGLPEASVSLKNNVTLHKGFKPP